MSSIPFDLVVAGGMVVDGTGAPARRADVAIRAGRIAIVATPIEAAVRRRIDAAGLVVAPGFVDAHGHSDLAALSAPRSPSKIQQGITTEVMGNCGVAVAPVGPDATIDDIRALFSIIDVDPAVPWSWRRTAEYLDLLEHRGTALNFAMLAGHLPIRASCVGFADRPATAGELAAMQELTDAALRDGACGLSTGLMYPPNAYADLDELVALGEVVADHGKVFTFHMRDYGDRLLDSVTEALTVAQRCGVKVQISHLAVIGRRNWGKARDALLLVDGAIDLGLDVAVDIYPYVAGSTNLTQLLPAWALEGGASKLLARLSDPHTRTLVENDVESMRLHEWNEVVIAGGDFGAGQLAEEIVGRSVADLAADRGCDGATALVDLAVASRATATIVAFGRSEDDLGEVLRHPRCIIGSDGLGLDATGPSGSGQPHPRSYGCYPRLLGRYVREHGSLSLEEAVRKSTSAVADRFGIPDRGRLAPGQIADIVVFDAGSVIDQATYQQPQRPPLGVRAVLVGGTPVMTDGVQNDALPGRVLRMAGRPKAAQTEEDR